MKACFQMMGLPLFGYKIRKTFENSLVRILSMKNLFVFTILSFLVLFSISYAQAEDTVLSKKEMETLSVALKVVFDARTESDRGAERRATLALAELIAETEKDKGIEDFLKHSDQWHRIREGTINTKNKAFKRVGKGFSKGEFIDDTEVDDRPYIFYVSLPKEYDPKGSERFPVILFLHPEIQGKKKADKETQKMLKTLFDDDELLSKYIVLAPVGPMVGSRKRKSLIDSGKDWEAMEYGKKTAFIMCRVLMEQMVFDRSKVFLYGIDKSGLSCFRYATWHPSFFAGVIGRDARIGDLAMANVAQIPFLYVSSSENSRKDVASKWAGEYAKGEMPQVTFIEDSGELFEPSEEAAGKVREWLDKVSKNTTPPEVFLKTVDLATASSSWLRIEDLNASLEMGLDDPEYPWINATVDSSSNTILIDSQNVQKIKIFLNDKIVNMDEKITVLLNGENRFEGKKDRNLDKMLDLVYYNIAGDFEIYCNFIDVSEEYEE